MANKRLKIDEVLENEDIHTFKKADEKEKILEELKKENEKLLIQQKELLEALKNNKSVTKKVNLKDNKLIKILINKEVYKWLEKQKKENERTAHAVVKRIITESFKEQRKNN